jgi:hypothetical protein
MTETSRRTLLRVGAIGVVLAPFASARTAFAAVTTARGLYTRSRFTQLRGASFRLVGANGSWPVTLSRVSDLPHTRRGDKLCFGLTFRTKVAGPPQGSYVLRRSRFKSTTLFVVPSDANRRIYQAVVNGAS